MTQPMLFRVKQFAGKMYEALNDDSWGDIEPDLFDEIATVDPEDWSDDAKGLAECLRKAL